MGVVAGDEEEEGVSSSAEEGEDEDREAESTWRGGWGRGGSIEGMEEE